MQPLLQVSDELLADNKRTMLENAKERILAIDSSKFGATAFMTVGRLKDITMIVTDEKPEMKWLKEFWSKTQHRPNGFPGMR